MEVGQAHVTPMAKEIDWLGLAATWIGVAISTFAAWSSWRQAELRRLLRIDVLLDVEEFDAGKEKAKYIGITITNTSNRIVTVKSVRWRVRGQEFDALGLNKESTDPQRDGNRWADVSFPFDISSSDQVYFHLHPDAMTWTKHFMRRLASARRLILPLWRLRLIIHARGSKTFTVRIRSDIRSLFKSALAQHQRLHG